MNWICMKDKFDPALEVRKISLPSDFVKKWKIGDIIEIEVDNQINKYLFIRKYDKEAEWKD